MERRACDRCGETFAEASLLYHDRGRVCGECEAALDEEAAEARRIRNLMVSGPVLAFTALGGLMGGLIPILGLLFLVVTPIIAVLGLVQGGRAMLAARDPALGDGQRGARAIGGVLSALWCLAVLPLSALMLVGGAVAALTMM